MKIKMTNYLVVPLLCLLTSPLWAEPIPEWVGSYSVDGQCYCAPGISESLQNRIMPTPIGGQSVGQICQRIGKGPAFELTDAGFNHPAYHDAQCGNGPFTLDSDGCDGRLANNDSICSGIGPEWDLKAIYSKPKTDSEPPSTVVAAETAVEESPEPKQPAVIAPEPELTAEQQAADDARAAEVAAARVAAAWAKAQADNAAAARLEAAKIAASRRALADNQAARKKAEELEQARVEAAQREQETQASARVEADQEALERRQAERAPELAVNTQAQQLEAAQKAEAERIEAAAVAQAEQDRLALESEKVAAKAEADRRQAELALANASAAEPMIEPEVKPEFKPGLEQKTELSEPKLQADVAAVDAAKQEVTDSVAESNVAQPGDTPAAATAVRLPKKFTAVDPSSGYIQFAPVSYDFGGAGPSLEGVLGIASAWTFKGRAAVVEEYSELMVGISRFFKPDLLKGGIISLLAGWEYGNFDLGITELTDSGAMLDGSLAFIVTPRMSLAAGVSYSSFFEGDPSVYGQLLFRMVNNLDFTTRVEGGDNDNFAFGLRYNY